MNIRDEDISTLAQKLYEEDGNRGLDVYKTPRAKEYDEKAIEILSK